MIALGTTNKTQIRFTRRSDTPPEDDEVKVVLIKDVVHNARMSDSVVIVQNDFDVIRLTRHLSVQDGTTERLTVDDTRGARVKHQVVRHVLYVTMTTTVRGVSMG